MGKIVRETISERVKERSRCLDLKRKLKRDMRKLESCFDDWEQMMDFMPEDIKSVIVQIMDECWEQANNRANNCKNQQDIIHTLRAVEHGIKVFTVGISHYKTMQCSLAAIK